MLFYSSLHCGGFVLWPDVAQLWITLEYLLCGYLFGVMDHREDVMSFSVKVAVVARLYNLSAVVHLTVMVDEVWIMIVTGHPGLLIINLLLG